MSILLAGAMAAVAFARLGITIGSPAWHETLRRLREGPNNARERRMLVRRRARLRRIGDDKAQYYKGRRVTYCDTDSVMTADDRLYRVGVGRVFDAEFKLPKVYRIVKGTEP